MPGKIIYGADSIEIKLSGQLSEEEHAALLQEVSSHIESGRVFKKVKLHLSDSSEIDDKVLGLIAATKTEEISLTYFPKLKHDAICRGLVQIIALGQIKKLDLKDCTLKDEGLSILHKALATSSLTEIDLTNNEIGDEGVKLLADILRRNPNITTLNLSLNNIGDEGLSTLAEVLATNSPLQNLNLSFNEITEVEALTPAIAANKNLVRLSLSRNRLDINQYIDLCHGLANNVSLEYLGLNEQRIMPKDEESVDFGEASATTKLQVIIEARKAIGLPIKISCINAEKQDLLAQTSDSDSSLPASLLDSTIEYMMHLKSSPSTSPALQEPQGLALHRNLNHGQSTSC